MNLRTLYVYIIIVIVDLFIRRTGQNQLPFDFTSLINTCMIFVTHVCSYFIVHTYIYTYMHTYKVFHMYNNNYYM